MLARLKGESWLIIEDPKPAARDAKALELPVVKATDDGLLTDFADFGGFASRENGLHGFSTLLGAGPVARVWSAHTAFRESLPDRFHP